MRASGLAALIWALLGTALWTGVARAEGAFPLAIGGDYSLVDQHGQTRTQADPDGHAQLVFFGYVNCPDICTAALPLMAEIVDTLATEGRTVTPVMITVAPEVDRVETMGAPLAKWHPRFIGLTGPAEALQQAYDAFKVEIVPLFQDPEHGWIYSHGSFLHLLDGNGDILTLLPPILPAAQAADIVRGYVAEARADIPDQTPPAVVVQSADRHRAAHPRTHTMTSRASFLSRTAHESVASTTTGYFRNPRRRRLAKVARMSALSPKYRTSIFT